jgi:hypothetical protein
MPDYDLLAGELGEEDDGGEERKNPTKYQVCSNCKR